MKTKLGILASILLQVAITTCLLAADGKNEGKSLNNSEQTAKGYLESFQQTGVPTPNAVDAAFRYAREKPTIENWETAAKLANSFANIVSVLSERYLSYYGASRSKYSEGNKSYLDTAVEYERAANGYLSLRNDAYVELAKLYLNKGEKAKALSFAVTVVKLGGTSPDYAAEQLLLKIIEYKK